MASLEHELSRKERLALDVLFQRGDTTVGELLEALPDTPSYSAARALLNVLVSKGLAQATKKPGERSHVYSPTTSPKRASKNALQRVVGTFFEGSASKLVANLLDPKDVKLAPDEIQQLRDILNAHDQSNTKKK